MDLEREPASSSSSSSAPSPSPEESSAEEAAAETLAEIEAAETLAGLAQLAMRERAAESSARWGSKGKRLWKRVKSESPPCDSALNQVDSVAPSPDLAEEAATQEQQQMQEVHGSISFEAVKSEQDDDSLKPNFICAPRGRPSGVGRSRHNLTEEEREVRRIRRVLANRESARQTIRRRQALCEDLTRKAADLAHENENLKREKEFALKRYQSLETTNKQLKTQVLKAIKKTEAGQAHEVLKSSNVEMSASSSNTFPFSYNQHPFQQIFWPHMIQTSHPMQPQLGTDNAFMVQSIIHGSPPGNPVQSEQQDNLVNSNGLRAPLCIMPCPWFFPLPDQGNVIQPYSFFGSKNTGDVFPLKNHSSANSSPNTVTATERENLPPYFPSEDKEEASGSNESRPIGGFYESLGWFPRNGDGHEGLHLKEPPSPAVPAFILKHENTIKSYAATDEATLMKPSCLLGDLPEKNQGVFDQSYNKLAHAVAATEARKRRKELTKLKSIHGRQCRINV